MGFRFLHFVVLMSLFPLQDQTEEGEPSQVNHTEIIMLIRQWLLCVPKFVSDTDRVDHGEKGSVELVGLIIALFTFIK